MRVPGSMAVMAWIMEMIPRENSATLTLRALLPFAAASDRHGCCCCIEPTNG